MQDVSGPGFLIDMLHIVNKMKLRYDRKKVVVTAKVLIVVLRHLNVLSLPEIGSWSSLLIALFLGLYLSR